MTLSLTSQLSGLSLTLTVTRHSVSPTGFQTFGRAPPSAKVRLGCFVAGRARTWLRAGALSTAFAVRGSTWDAEAAVVHPFSRAKRSQAHQMQMRALGLWNASLAQCGHRW